MIQDQPTEPVIYPGQKPKQRGCSCLGRLFLVIVFAVAFIVFTGVVVTTTLIYTDLSDEVEVGISALDAARNRKSFETTRIFDRNGQLLWEIFGEGKRTKVSLDKIPEDFIQAVVANRPIGCHARRLR